MNNTNNNTNTNTNTNKITIDAHVIRAALTIPTKTGNRGLFFDSTEKRLVATDNTVLYICRDVETFEDDVILKPFKIPARAQEVSIEQIENSNNEYLVTCRWGVMDTATTITQAMTGEYVNYKNLLGESLRRIGCHSKKTVTLDLSYLGRIGKFLKHARIDFTETTDPGVAVITNDDDGESAPREVVLLSARLGWDVVLRRDVTWAWEKISNFVRRDQQKQNIS